MRAILRDKVPALPPALEGLATIALNLSWSWHRDARALFARLDPLLWHQTRHNPIRFLRDLDPERLTRLAADETFVAEVARVAAWLGGEATNYDTWFNREFPEVPRRPVAYFCAEFGLHNSVPIYSGGLGILAGDHCKAASDLGVPMVGIGLFYQKGYFDQRLRLDGWQEDGEELVDPDRMPLVPLVGVDGADHVAVVRTCGRAVHVRAWSLAVGRTRIYLLDTNLPSNHPDDRGLLNNLYGGGEELRLRQEWILGVGGVRVLRALGVDPGVWHANEGHAAFMLLERLRERTIGGLSLAESMAEVRRESVFTTHTPVPAGHDTFAGDAVLECMGPVWEEMGTTREEVLALAAHPTRNHGRFDMTALAIRLSRSVNGVSVRHGAVSRGMWAPLWPERPVGDIPIGAITNGVHLATWMANPMMALLDEHLGPGWGARADDPALWDRVLSLDARALWAVHLELKDILFRYAREDARRRFADAWREAAQVVGAGALLDPGALTIGFARRFATYKRAHLIFSDPDRLHRLLVNARRPVQLLIAGKAHPADTPGKEVLRRVYRFTHDPFYEGRVAFLEDYGMHPAHLLVQGVDLWLNLPRVPLEASGTSGMKAALNGVPQLSTLDGWWEEGFDGTNGWALPRIEDLPAEEADAADAEALYRTLETEVVPLYYERDADGIPLGWVARMRAAIRTSAARFTAERMVRDYTSTYYIQAMRGDPHDDQPPRH